MELFVFTAAKSRRQSQLRFDGLDDFRPFNRLKASGVGQAENG
jgi:hypothetical protein